MHPADASRARTVIMMAAALVVSGASLTPRAHAQVKDSATVRADSAKRSVLTLSPLLVSAERTYSAASSGSMRAIDFALRPRASTQQLLTVAPGLVVAQHAGGGKAEQIFLRGFDADHGTDVAVSVDGTPANLVSHAHGHGYADLHFVPADLVERIDVRKGPYDARDGDLATAGAITLRTRDRVGAAWLTAGLASFGERTLRGALPLGGAAQDAGGYVYGSITRGDGPFDVAQNLARINLFGRWTAPLGETARARATVSAYDASWNASGQLPQRAVASGELGRFGAIDPSEGGTTSRYEANITLSGGRGTEWSTRAWLVRYELDLFSNFTFFLNDSIDGDGIVQRDRRTATGVDARVTRAGSLARMPATHEAGVGLRADFARVLLGRQRQRVEGARITDARVRPAHAFASATEAIELGHRVQLNAGVRLDAFRFDAREGNTHATRETALISPKLSMRFDATDNTQVFANAGGGFHSNDARDALGAVSGETIVPRARGAELGVRHTREHTSVALALWGLDLESELVYVGDEGTTEALGRSRRIGIDVEARVRLQPWLWADADLNLARGRLRDEAPGTDRIPLAPGRTATAGLTVRDAGPVSAALRVRHIAARPADEASSIIARGHTLAELFTDVQLNRVQLRAGIENLFNSEWNEAQFATTSRLPGEAAPVTELHFTPGAPRNLRLELSWRF